MTANATARLLHSSTLAETALDLPELINSKLDTVRRMRAVHRRYDEIMDSIIFKRRQLMRNTPSDELPHDFLQVVLSKETAEDPHERLSVQEVKGIIADILAGGIHTSAATIEWGMTQLLRKRACMQKLQEEVDGVMKGKEGQQVTDEAAATMPYLEKVVKEILRLHPVVPMLPPRMSNQDCKVGEYSIPKGTQAIVNAWAIARDPALWGDTAQEFMPERFDEKQVELSAGQHFELLAFGSGRRICPGLRLGLSIVHVTIANLVHAYNWSAPPSALLAASSLDLSENPSTLTNTKATPLLAIPTPRHPPPSLFSLSAA
ncbi:hypothetical protein GOP47_0016644 [Adiantum capillus-veneris]|uniref:Cytochrome P450 n=1 Tax=Adiantum capillus-veneris TaxID=13818 RepID=A0A9D4UI29_ADICA|nr:hypothetical protein GOP47_0016644 [Adiantum capillus-veneris]